MMDFDAILLSILKQKINYRKEEEFINLDLIKMKRFL